MADSFRNLRKLALEKGTVPSGFDGSQVVQDPNVYVDPGEAARARLESEAGAPPEINPSPFKLDGGTK